MDRDLATRLANELQAMFLENVSMRRYLDELARLHEIRQVTDYNPQKTPDAQQVIEATIVNPENRALTKKVFQELQNQLESATTLDTVIEEAFLAIQQRQKVK